ncbi:uncharacterized protein LOC130824182 isoform X1 [Amaranthus tricolor]|uniref:uncharacterized protein LOC130824182 isoform X1 n=1 Tax=Amaranthus tricolor TaxID=29722 RepID=UPI00258D8670|nr:uncharacterized protein LOC130824182 isoform X1 [Amaranthus tricolor]
MEDEVKFPIFDLKPSYEAKIRELLRNISSMELKLCSDGAKEFMRLLRGNTGGELLHEYVRTSSKFSELLEVWNRRRGKPGMSYIMSLIAAILRHSDGIYKIDDHGRIVISRALDKFAKLIVEDKLDDVYRELNSKDGKRQKAALLLVASIVRRGSLLAAEVAKIFDFKLSILPKLSEYRRKKIERKRKHSTREAFIEFALSFLEVGKPGLIRWILQQREIFSGILRGLGNDDEETVVYVLSTLRDRVLTDDSSVTPGLRSVLFGSITLEQLLEISAREDAVLAAELAYDVLRKVCIDPSNGLMPDLKRHPSPLKGNQKRLVDLMKKLKATEIGYHSSLLLEIVKGKPSLASAYLDQFPYNLDDHTSSTWLPAVILAANVISSVSCGISWGFLDNQAENLMTFEASDVQSVLKCLCLRPFNRRVVNKGLLHSDFLVKHGTLRLLLEILKFLNSFIDALCFRELYSLKQKVQDEVLILLPDSQVLFTLLSSVSSFYETPKSTLKRSSDSESVGSHITPARKKSKTNIISEEIDIVVGGLDCAEKIVPGDTEKPRKTVATLQFDDENGLEQLMEIWRSYESSFSLETVKGSEVYFYCKLLEALEMYHRTFRSILEVSYDFLKILPNSPLKLPSILLQSLLSMLIEHIGCSREAGSSTKVLPPIYNHLQSFLQLSFYSPSRYVREKAYILAKAAMMSTGAFDNNPCEIASWFLFIPGDVAQYDGNKCQEDKLLQTLSSSVVSFLCDTVSTVGNNLVKHWEITKCKYFNVKTIQETDVNFSPLVVCALEKLLSSGLETFTRAEKSSISLYVCNTLKYLLQTQIDAAVLAAVIHQLLSKRIEKHMSAVSTDEVSCCVRTPMILLYQFSQSVLNQDTCNYCSTDGISWKENNSLTKTLVKVKGLLDAGSSDLVEISKMLYSTVACTHPEDVVDNFPSVMAISGELSGVNCAVMNYFCLDQNLIRRVSKLWSDMFYSGLRMSIVASNQVTQDNDDQASILVLHKNFEEIKYASGFLGSLLNEAPFYVLFPGIILCDLEQYSEIRELLLAKVSILETEQIVSSLRLVLFWFHQIQMSYRKNPSEQLELHSELCCLLVERIFARLSNLKVDSDLSVDNASFPFFVCLQEVAKSIFCHPALNEAFSFSFTHQYEFTEGFLRDITEGAFRLSEGEICKTELHILKLLTKTSDYFLALCSKEFSLSAYTECKENIVKMFRNLVQQIFLIFKYRFKMWYRSGDMTFFPILCAVVSLMQFISPIELLKLADWMFMELTDFSISRISDVCPSSLAFAIASGAFNMLYELSQSSNIRVVLSDLFWVTKMRSLDSTLFERMYFKAINFATCFKTDFATCAKQDFASICLHKALSAAHSLIYRQDCLPFSTGISRVVAITPVRIISYCLDKTDITKATILFLLIEMSVLHASVFGMLFSDILRADNAHNVNVRDNICSQSLSGEECLMLMPAAGLYVSFSWTKLGIHCYRYTECILASYSKLLLDGFSKWNDFVSKTVFHVEFDNNLSSVENIDGLFSDSLLQKAVHMLQWYFTSSADNKDERLKLFHSLFPGALAGFMDFDVRHIDTYSVGQLTNLTNRVVAKISLCFVLLYPEDKKCSSNESHAIEGDSFGGSDVEKSLTVRFLDLLVYIWQHVVEKYPSASDNPSLGTPICLLLRSLEIFTLRSIYRLIMKIRNVLIQMDSLPFIKKMAKVCFRYRFEDPATIENLRRILSSLSEGKLPIVLLLQLLLGHSQLASTIGSIVGPSTSASFGIVVKPLSSFLRLLSIPTEKSNLEKSERYKSQLEVLKLLRLLFHLRATQNGSVSENDLGVNLRELSLLLLTSYGATVSEIDLKIYNILSEIESADGMDKKIMVDQDYLWGRAVRKGKRHAMGHISLKSDIADDEDCRRSQYRDHFPIDPKLVLQTVLYFPYGRTASEMILFPDVVRNTPMGHSTKIGRMECYDPFFILSFSIHSLTMGFLDPVEFSGLGLLAIAFVSMGSPEDGIRKLAYEVVLRFKFALMGCQKKREVTKLKLLLTYLQNGIEEPCQKIPSIFSVFVAEASVILLDPSYDQYSAISNFLLESPPMNLKAIPLFHDNFWSNSRNFRTDRMWMLCLLYAGINSEDDALIYIKNSVFEILLSVYTSPLSDIESKELILLVLKKCVQVPKTACYLVENCCLISWLSSILASAVIDTNFEGILYSKKLILLLEVVHETVSSRSTVEWLQKHALEQLSDLLCHLWNLLIRCSKLVLKKKTLVILILEIIVAALKLSQRNNMSGPYFTPSIQSIYQLYQTVDVHDDSGDSAVYGLKSILFSTPPTTISDLNLEDLSKFLVWAVSTALRSDSQQALLKQHFPPSFSCTEEYTREEPLTSTLLRWLVASIILWRLSFRNSGCNSDFVVGEANGDTLLSLIKYVGPIGEGCKLVSGSKEILAATVIHLHQVLGIKCQTLQSVVAALSLLLFADGSYAAQGDLSSLDTSIDLQKRVSLWSKISSPNEANPSWRWSFYEPWVADAPKRTDLEKMEESHACQKLMVLISTMEKTSDHKSLSPQELESSGFFEWERTKLQKD